jgi:hypothetical protein
MCHGANVAGRFVKKYPYLRSGTVEKYRITDSLLARNKIGDE